MDMISGFAGVLLSVLFSYIPGARGWFDKLAGEQKRLVMLGACLIVPLVMLGISCAGFAVDFGLTNTCDRAGFVLLIRAFAIAVIANQATYQISPKPNG